MKQKKTYGKTTKQWNKLYNEYRNELKGEHNLSKLSKKEFKLAWINRSNGTTVKDIARQTRKEDEYSKYEREYSRAEESGYQLGSKLSKKAFLQQRYNYSNIKNMVESQYFVSKKQAENWSEHAKKLGLNIKPSDFFKMNELHDKFWDLIESLGGWEEAFEY